MAIPTVFILSKLMSLINVMCVQSPIELGSCLTGGLAGYVGYRQEIVPLSRTPHGRGRHGEEKAHASHAIHCFIYRLSRVTIKGYGQDEEKDQEEEWEDLASAVQRGGGGGGHRAPSQAGGQRQAEAQAGEAPEGGAGPGGGLAGRPAGPAHPDAVGAGQAVLGTFRVGGTDHGRVSDQAA